MLIQAPGKFNKPAAGFSDELSRLRSMLKRCLTAFPNTVPEDRSVVDWYTEIWGSDLLISVPVYGYLQFKSVLMVMDEDMPSQTIRRITA